MFNSMFNVGRNKLMAHGARMSDYLGLWEVAGTTSPKLWRLWVLHELLEESIFMEWLQLCTQIDSKAW